jgi:hypothetical protein
MTTLYEQPVNFAGEGAQVGVQAQKAYIDTVTLSGDVQLTVAQDASPEAKYRAGVENLKSGNPQTARKLIWDAMMSGHGGSDVLFHWLVAMLSGRTVRQFSVQEIGQLQRSQSRYTEAQGDAWADGVRLIYRLLETVLPSPSAEAGPAAAKTDMSLLVRQFDSLGKRQRDMFRPHLELFLTGPLMDEMWRRKLRFSHSGQYTDGRTGRAWMYFQPVPAQVSLPSPPPESVTAVHRLGMCACMVLFAAAVGYLGWELLWHSAFLGLLSCAAALAGGVIAAAADLESRFLTGRRVQKDKQFKVPPQSAPRPLGNELPDRVDKLFNRYFGKYEPDTAERQRWEAAAAGHRKFYRDEIIIICRGRGIPANEVAWLIRYEVRELKQHWRNETLHEYRWVLRPRPRTTAARGIGLAVLLLGGIWAAAALRAYPLGGVAALLSALGAWWCWLRVNLERRRHAAESEEHAQRQALVDEEFRQWSGRLEARPKDADMVAWLGCDQTVLLGRALDHFHLPLSQVIAHAFIEQPGVAVKRARIEGGPWRYAGYRLQVFLLAQDGVRQIRANLNFITGTLSVRERKSYRYDSIVSMRFLQETRRQTFELRLTDGDLITVRVRDADPGEAQQDQDAVPAEAEEAEAEDSAAADASSMTDLLNMLERAVGENRKWFQGRDEAGTWSDGDEDDPGQQYA